MNGDDEFWSLAMEPPSITSKSAAAAANSMINDSDEEDMLPIMQAFTILPPEPSSLQTPLTLTIHMNCNDGILADVSGIPWDAALLLSGFLYGTSEGRRFCYDACSFTENDNAMHDGGGILELGSGLGIVGLAAAASALAMKAEEDRSNILSENDTNKKYGRVVLTDLNDTEILSRLKRNVDANIDMIAETTHTPMDTINILNNNSRFKSKIGDLTISVEPCDWVDISHTLELDSNNIPMTRETSSELMTDDLKPSRPFNLIIGSALVYLPGHACAAADTIFYYLRCNNHENKLESSWRKRQAIILQLPDRAGFTTHFLPRCQELGLSVTCRELDEELVKGVQQGWDRRIPSVGDYRLYFIFTSS